MKICSTPRFSTIGLTFNCLLALIIGVINRRSFLIGDATIHLFYDNDISFCRHSSQIGIGRCHIAKRVMRAHRVVIGHLSVNTVSPISHYLIC